MDNPVELETRLARVEASVDAIIRDMGTLSGNVKELASCVRQQGTQTEEQLKSLLVQVTSAAGPKKTDWHLIVTSIGVTLAIGAAVFAPLNLRVNDLQDSSKTLTDKLENHSLLPSHPVSAVRLDFMEKVLAEREIRNAAALSATDLKLQQECRLICSKIELAINALDTRLQTEIETVDKKADKALLFTEEAREVHGRQNEQLRSLMERSKEAVK